MSVHFSLGEGGALVCVVPVFDRNRSSAKMPNDATQLVLAVLGGIAVYEVVRPFFVRRKEERDEKVLPVGMIEEMLSRHEAFFGREGQAAVRGAKVLVLGLGGVGSHTAVMLARAGVKSLRIVDFDLVSLSSLNRHAVATLSDVGTLKTLTMARFIARVAPFVEVDERPLMFAAETCEELLDGEFDLVVDCIDDVTTKAVLVDACVRRGLPIICAMGAGGKADPTRLRVAPLADAVHDPLASKLRWKLRGKGIDYGGSREDDELFRQKKDVVKADPDDVLCIYSCEAPRCGLLPLTEEQAEEGAANFGTVDLAHYRVRVLPVLGPSPAMMGHAIASISLCRLAGYPVAPSPYEPLSKKIKEKMFVALKKREARRAFGSTARHDQCTWMDCLVSELEFIIAEVWRARCAVTNRKLDRKPLALTRWWRSKRPFGLLDTKEDAPLVPADELVLLAPHLADALDDALDTASRNGTDLFLAAAGALGGVDHAKRIDARIYKMRHLASGSWDS